MLSHMVSNYLHYFYNIPVIAPLSGVFHICLSPSLDRVVIFKAITTYLLGLYCFMGAQNFTVSNRHLQTATFIDSLLIEDLSCLPTS